MEQDDGESLCHHANRVARCTKYRVGDRYKTLLPSRGRADRERSSLKGLREAEL